MLTVNTIGNDVKCNASNGTVSVAKNAKTFQQYFVCTKKNQFVEIYVMPKYILKINGSENPTIELGKRYNIEVYEECPNGNIYKIDQSVLKGKNAKSESYYSFSVQANGHEKLEIRTGQVIGLKEGEGDVKLTRRIVRGKVNSYLTSTIHIKVVKNLNHEFRLNFEKNTTDNVSNMPSTITIVTTEKAVYKILPTNRPKRNGYIFLGWSSYPNATEAEYQPGNKISIWGSGTLYAVWKQNTKTEAYNIRYDKNTTDTVKNMPTGPTAAKKGVSTKLSSNVPARTGYTFLGWATSKDATTAAYKAGGTITVNNPITLYAVWQKNNAGAGAGNGGGTGTGNGGAAGTGNGGAAETGTRAATGDIPKENDKLELKSGYAWFTYINPDTSKEPIDNTKNKKRYVALLEGDQIQVEKQAGGKWLKVKVIKTNKRTSEKNFKDIKTVYIYYGKDASKCFKKINN